LLLLFLFSGHTLNEISVKSLEKGGELYVFPSMQTTSPKMAQFQLMDDDTNNSYDSEHTTTSSIYKQQNKSAGVIMQFFLLYHRYLLCAKRNYVSFFFKCEFTCIFFVLMLQCLPFIFYQKWGKFGFSDLLFRIFSRILAS
jgi:hypothetical protein